MKFGRKKDEKKGKEESCASCGVPMGPGMPMLPPGMSKKDALKQIQELEKKRAKPVDCPYLETCDQKMLPNLGVMVCLDQEVGGRQSQGYMAHMAGHHVWETCRKFADTKRLEQGVLPRELKKTVLKAKKK